MQTAGEPAPLQKTQPFPGQECFLYTYVLLKEPKDGIIGLFKFFSAHDDVEKCKSDFIRVADTNQQCPMKWGISGEWEVIRTPETDVDGTIDIVKFPGEDEEFMGEKLPTRDVPKDIESFQSVKDRASIDTFKTNVKMKMEEEKRVQLRKQAMEELQGELDDPKSISSYAQLHWKRLTQKSAIAEYQEKVKEAQASLMKTLKELNVRKRQFPHYENQWQNEIRRIHKLMAPKQEGNNPVDKPVANLGDEDDLELAEAKYVDLKDEFDQGIGVEAKGKEEVGDDLNDEDIENDEEVSKRLDALKDEAANVEDKISRSFLPEAPIKKLGPSGRNGKKNKNKKKNGGGRK